MPAFMAISGYLAFRPNMNEGEYVKPLYSVIYRRFRQLIIPFLIWTFLLLLINGKLSLDNIGVYLLYPDKGLWFLWVLFFITVFFNLGNRLSVLVHVKQELVIAALCLLFAGSMVLFEKRVFGFQFIAYYFIIYSLGYYLHKYYDMVMTKNTFVLALMVACWGILAWFWRMHDLPNAIKALSLPITLTQYAYRFITAALAIYILLAVSPKSLDTNSKWNTPFISFGGLSLGIYTVHFLLIGRVVSLCCSFISNESIIVILSFVMTLLISWLVVYLLSKWFFTAKWFLGKI